MPWLSITVDEVKVGMTNTAAKVHDGQPVTISTASQPTSLARLKVLHVVRQFSPSRGGLETYVAELARRQTARHDVTVLTLDRLFDLPGSLAREETSDGVKIVRIPFVGVRKIFLPFVSRSFLRGFDIIHIHATDQLGDIIAMMSWSGLPPFVITTHGMYFHTRDLYLLKAFYLRTITRISLRKAHEVFAVSGNDHAILKNVGIKSTLLRNPVIPYGEFVGRGAAMLYVGRISANKQIERIVDFARVLRERGRPTEIFIVGADTEGLWPSIAAHIIRYSLGGLVRRYGFVAPEDLSVLAQRCGFVISASRYEGYGLSVVEGMSVGLLPVVQRNAAFTETVELSGCGLVTDFEDPEHAATDFLNWSAGVTETDRQNAISFARTQSWDHVVDVVEQSYRAATGT